MKKLLIAILLLLPWLLTGCVRENYGLPTYLKIYSNGGSCYLNADWRGDVPEIERIEGDNLIVNISYSNSDRDQERDTIINGFSDAIMDTIVNVGINKAYPCEVQWITIDRRDKGYKITGRKNETGHKREIKIFSSGKIEEGKVIIYQK